MRHRRPDKLDEWKNETRIQSDYWEGPLASPDDRRQRSRRQAAPKEIQFRLSEGATAKPGFVIDRSSGGLRLALEEANAEETASSDAQTFVRQGQKVGRNDPCPCGSGKKYKQCHGKLT